MRPKPATYAGLVGALVLAAALCLSMYLAWRNGAYLALVPIALLELLVLWAVADMLGQGFRPPTAFERFERRQLTRFILIVFGGGMILALLKWAGYNTFVLMALPVFLAVSLYSAGKLRSRDETSAGYKARTGYRDPEQFDSGCEDAKTRRREDNGSS